MAFEIWARSKEFDIWFQMTTRVFNLNLKYFPNILILTNCQNFTSLFPKTIEIKIMSSAKCWWMWKYHWCSISISEKEMRHCNDYSSNLKNWKPGSNKKKMKNLSSPDLYIYKQNILWKKWYPRFLFWLSLRDSKKQSRYFEGFAFSKNNIPCSIWMIAFIIWR